MSTKEIQEQICSNMKKWQKIEDASIEACAKISKQSDNPIVRIVMEIIMRDSVMHHRVQQMIVDSLEGGTIALTPEEVADVWTLIEEHIRLERKTIEFAKEALEAIKGRKMIVQQYLLEYMLQDEEKHNKILDNLEGLKKGMYPYA
jgi:bacterioferritin (cytochrome b1)